MNTASTQSQEIARTQHVENDRDSQRPQYRIDWIDAARGLAIILVVLGHVLAGMLASDIVGGHRDSIETVVRFIYTFHMPVFLVLAGVFAPRAMIKPGRVFWAEKLAGLMYPYFLWSVVQYLLQVAMSKYTNNYTSIVGIDVILYDPIMQFWFLYCLFVAFALDRLIAMAGGGGLSFLAVTILITCVLSMLESSPTSLPGRIRDFQPFFAIGAVLSTLILRWSHLKTATLLLFVIAGFTFTGVALELRYEPRMLTLLTLPIPGTMAVFALAELVVRSQRAVSLMYLGRLSLEIYLVHVIVYAGVRIILQRFLGINSVPVHIACGLLFGISVPLLLAGAARRARFPYLFRWPIHN